MGQHDCAHLCLVLRVDGPTDGGKGRGGGGGRWLRLNGAGNVVLHASPARVLTFASRRFPPRRTPTKPREPTPAPPPPRCVRRFAARSPPRRQTAWHSQHDLRGRGRRLDEPARHAAARRARGAGTQALCVIALANTHKHTHTHTHKTPSPPPARWRRRLPRTAPKRKSPAWRMQTRRRRRRRTTSRLRRRTAAATRSPGRRCGQRAGSSSQPAQRRIRKKTFGRVHGVATREEAREKMEVVTLAQRSAAAGWRLSRLLALPAVRATQQPSWRSLGQPRPRGLRPTCRPAVGPPRRILRSPSICAAAGPIFPLCTRQPQVPRCAVCVRLPRLVPSHGLRERFFFRGLCWFIVCASNINRAVARLWLDNGRAQRARHPQRRFLGRDCRAADAAPIDD